MSEWNAAIEAAKSVVRKYETHGDSGDCSGTLILDELDALLSARQAQQEPVAGVADERKAFDKHFIKYGHGLRAYTSLNEIERQSAWLGWKARAALDEQRAGRGNPTFRRHE